MNSKWKAALSGNAKELVAKRLDVSDLESLGITGDMLVDAKVEKASYEALSYGPRRSVVEGNIKESERIWIKFRNGDKTEYFIVRPYQKERGDSIEDALYLSGCLGQAPEAENYKTLAYQDAEVVEIAIVTLKSRYYCDDGWCIRKAKIKFLEFNQALNELKRRRMEEFAEFCSDVREDDFSVYASVDDDPDVRIYVRS
ncbi:MAG: hypothetical protein LBG75_00220 [Candidatus Nomurabacteria bacterium]|nr:hypothetical protein [Candidatus Nomurabacteria bacterium]